MTNLPKLSFQGMLRLQVYPQKLIRNISIITHKYVQGWRHTTVFRWRRNRVRSDSEWMFLSAEWSVRMCLTEWMGMIFWNVVLSLLSSFVFHSLFQWWAVVLHYVAQLVETQTQREAACMHVCAYRHCSESYVCCRMLRGLSALVCCSQPARMTSGLPVLLTVRLQMVSFNNF